MENQNLFEQQPSTTDNPSNPLDRVDSGAEQERKARLINALKQQDRPWLATPEAHGN
jgi:hypothetical protein